MNKAINRFKFQQVLLLLFIIITIGYAVFAYDLNREESLKLIGLYLGLFVLSYLLIKQCSSFKILVAASVIFRLVFLFAVPNLSQDFYRFIWDGRLLLEGFNPYLHLPLSFYEQGTFPINQGLELYNNMGEISTSNYTNYPPMNQLCFAIAGLLAGQSIIGSVVIFRVVIIAADIGIIYFGSKLLKFLKLPKRRLFWYALNPFIIIELTGNLHFEGVMLFFLIWSLYLLQRGKWQWSAVLFGCSVAVKLVPLMLLPLFFNFFGLSNDKNLRTIDFNKIFKFYLIAGSVIIGLYAPFFSTQFLRNYSQSIGLWFGQFEFNASIYYLAREIGFWISGYNEIATISKILSVTTVLFILGISIFKKHSTTQQLMTSMLLVISVYFFLSTTVHPWYISSVVLLCVFGSFRYPLVWSIVIVLSYLAYSNENFRENLWVIGFQYAVVYAILIYELTKKRPEIILRPN